MSEFTKAYKDWAESAITYNNKNTEYSICDKSCFSISKWAMPII